METMKLASRRIHYIPINHIAPNPAQPRRHFDPQSLRELADSIRLDGILQPLTVQKGHYTYTLVAGERRLRAAGLAGLDTVPCVILNIDEESRAVLALIENLQRSGLHYLEEAEAIARLIATFGLSQEEAAAKLGKSQSAVANKLRLLRLSEPCTALLRQYQLTERHARALLRLTDEEQRLTTLRHIGEQHLNVAQTEEYIEALLSEVQMMPPPRRPSYIIKDVRLFLNSIRRSVEIMQQAGVDACVSREEDEETITVTVQIPKRGKKAAAAAATSAKQEAGVVDGV